MIHIITYPNRTQTISCYLPDRTQPDRYAVAELQQVTELEETLERLSAVPGFFQGEQPRIEKIIVTPDFHKGAGIPIGTVMIPGSMGSSSYLLRAEAPYAYKEIDEVIAVHIAHQMAAPVARLEPVFTVKA